MKKKIFKVQPTNKLIDHLIEKEKNQNDTFKEELNK